MYEIGEYVVNSRGVCKIVDVTYHELNGITNQYYVIHPVYRSKDMEIMTPVNKVNFRRVSTKSKILEIIDSIPNNNHDWIKDNKERKALFSKIMSSGDLSDISKMISTLYYYQIYCKENHRNFSLSDKNVYDSAKDLFGQEIAIVLDIPYEDVEDFVNNRIHLF